MEKDIVSLLRAYVFRGSFPEVEAEEFPHPLRSRLDPRGWELQKDGAEASTRGTLNARRVEVLQELLGLGRDFLQQVGRVSQHQNRSRYPSS